MGLKGILVFLRHRLDGDKLLQQRLGLREHLPELLAFPLRNGIGKGIDALSSLRALPGIQGAFRNGKHCVILGLKHRNLRVKR